MWPFGKNRNQKAKLVVDWHKDPNLRLDLQGNPEQMGAQLLQRLEYMLNKYPEKGFVEITTEISEWNRPRFTSELVSLMIASGHGFDLKVRPNQNVSVRLYTAPALSQ